MVRKYNDDSNAPKVSRRPWVYDGRVLRFQVFLVPCISSNPNIESKVFDWLIYKIMTRAEPSCLKFSSMNLVKSLEAVPRL